MIQLNWYKIFGVQIPDGSTVLPTDDIQIWLHCANIWDKSYTTLAEVIADTTTLSALISSNNAVDYLVRSTDWIGNVAVVPTMTDNTHPYGRAVTLTNLADAYKAFDNDLSTGPSHDGTVSKEGYIFDTPVKLSKWGNYANVNPSNTNENRFSIEYTDDGVTWTSLPTEYHRTNVALTWEYFTIADEVSEHLGWWIVHHDLSSREIQFFNSGITTSSTAMTYIGLNNYCANKLLADATWRTAICNSTYFESVLNVKVPTMTDNTHPSGEVSASSTYSGFQPYYAFDGNDATNDWWTSNGAPPQYLEYKFDNPKRVIMIAIRYLRKRIANYRIEGSNDNATWTTLYSDTMADGTSEMTALKKYPFSNSNTYSYYRIYVSSNYSNNNVNIWSLQFYGRKDV